jgi:hypothetical protein
MVLIAITNGFIRQKYFTKKMNELRAHQLSALSWMILFSIYMWVITSIWDIYSFSQSIQIGLTWLGMTIIFEFLFGHFVMKHSWNKLLHDYNILKGRLWIIVLFWLTIAPAIFFFIRH